MANIKSVPLAHDVGRLPWQHYSRKIRAPHLQDRHEIYTTTRRPSLGWNSLYGDAVLTFLDAEIYEGLKPSDARYHLLMAEASRSFRKALKKLATEKGYDLIAESGAILVKGKFLIDITKLVIKKVKSAS